MSDDVQFWVVFENVQFSYMRKYSMCASARGECVCVLCVRGSFAVGSLSQPLPHRSPLAPLPLTSHLPHGLPPADPHPASSSSSLFYLFSFIFLASCNHDIKVRSLSDRNIHLRELRRIYLYLLLVSASGVK